MLILHTEQIADMNRQLKGILVGLEIEQRRVDTTCSCGHFIHMTYEFTEHKEGLMTGLYFCCPSCSNGLYIPDAKELAKQELAKAKHLMPDEEILELCDEFKTFMESYVQQYGFEKEDGLEYFAHAFDGFIHKKDWQSRNDKAWELAKRAVKGYGFANK